MTSEFLKVVDALPFYLFTIILLFTVIVAFFYYSYHLVTFGLRCCLKCCIDIRLAPCSCCWNILIFVCPRKIKKFFKKYFINKILNFLKNRSRPLIDIDYGPLDRELKEDEDLLNSDKRKVSAPVYVPLGLYIMNVFVIAFVMSLRSFLVKADLVEKTRLRCLDDNVCFNETHLHLDYYSPYDINSALMTFGSVTVAYYLTLTAISLLFQYCYRVAKILRHCLILLGIAVSFFTYYFGIIIFLERDDIITSFLVSIGFLSALIIPWEKVYTMQYMKGGQRNGQHSCKKEEGHPLEEVEARDDSVVVSNSHVAVTVIDMEEEEENFRSSSSYHAL